MKFAKDILFIDFEGRFEPTQIGAILLDKETLAEKDSFSTYIYTDLQGRVSPTSGITQEMLEGAPLPAEVGKMLYKKFGNDFFLGSWAANLDITHFEKIMSLAGYSVWETFDYHILDIWPIAYVYLLKQGYTGGVRSEEMFREFGMPPRGSHDALEDCRIAADILRKIVM